MSDRLKIGISTKRGFFQKEGAEQFTTMSTATHALRACAAQPVDIVYLVPGETPWPVDGILMPGGGDIDPALYGRPDLRGELEEIDSEHDRAEIALVQWARTHEVPLLGVCRGIQVINVALGGTLVPRLANADQHFRAEAEADESKRPEPIHPLRVEAGSKLWSVLESSHVQVNSLHRGGPDAVAPGLRPTAWSPDGVIEAVESTDGAWLHAVLFHPEELCRSDARWLRLFRQFVDATQRAKARQVPQPSLSGGT